MKTNELKEVKKQKFQSNYLAFLLLIPLLISCGWNPSVNEQKEITDTVEGNDITVYTGATLFDGTCNRIDNSTIIIRNGRIEAVGGTDVRIPPQSNVVDLKGKYITPGLIDAHVHFSSTGFFDTRPHIMDSVNSREYQKIKAYQRKNLEDYFESYLRSGVTAVYDVGGPPWTIALQKEAENNLSAPHVAATGTLITPAPINFVSSVNPPVEKEMIYLSSDSLGRKVVQYNSFLGSTGIKIWGLQPDNDVFMKRIKAVADETEKLGNSLIIHANSLEEAKAALNLGASILVHGISEKEVDKQFIDLIKKKNAIYIPTLVVGEGYYNSYKAFLGDELVVEDINSVLDIRTNKKIQNASSFARFTDTTGLKKGIDFMKRKLKKEASIALPNIKEMYQNEITIAVGTDAGNPGTLHGISIHDELERMQQAGIPANDLIIMATKNGAMAMDRLEDFGTLEKGKMADLIILKKDPSQDISNMRSITHVMRGGKLMLVNEEFPKKNIAEF